MNYQNYEEYMRSVLGYSPYANNNYTYTDEQEDIYNYPNDQMQIQNTQNLTSFYPEIYKMVYPMVCKACNINSNREFSEELLKQMIDEIYNNIEPQQEENKQRSGLPPLKNGDVRNPNAKEPEFQTKETRQTNFLLRDLIRILLLREWERPGRPTIRPPFNPGERPPMGPGGPGMQPSRPGRPPIGAQPRPRYF